MTKIDNKRAKKTSTSDLLVTQQDGEEEADEQRDGVVDTLVAAHSGEAQTALCKIHLLEFGFLRVLLRYLFLCIIAQSYSVYVGYATALGEAAHFRPAL